MQISLASFACIMLQSVLSRAPTVRLRDVIRLQEDYGAYCLAQGVMRL